MGVERLFLRHNMNPTPASRSPPTTAPTATPAVAPVDSPDAAGSSVAVLDAAVSVAVSLASLASLDVLVFVFGCRVLVDVSADVVDVEGSLMLKVWLEKSADVSPVLNIQKLKDVPLVGSIPW